MNLENKAELFVIRAELSALKAEAESDLRRFGRGPSNLNAVRAVFNGHPMSCRDVIKAVWLKFPGLNVSKKQIAFALQSLTKKSEIHNRVVGCNQWKPGMYEKLSAVMLAFVLMSGCSVVKPVERMEQKSPELPPLPSHFTTPGRAPTVYEKRTPIGSRRSRAVPTTWTASPSWLMHTDTNVTGYVVGWGVADGAYPNTVVVPGRNNTNVVANVAKWQRWYFAVKATSPSGNSAYSPSVIRSVPATNVVEVQNTIQSALSPNGPWSDFYVSPKFRFLDPVGFELFRSLMSITNYLAE